MGAKKFLLILFGLIGTVYSIVGLCMFLAENKFKRNGVEITAVIEDIRRNYSGRPAARRNSNYDYDVFVSYFAEGDYYTEILHSYNSSMKIGDEITIYYIPDNPTMIAKKGARAFMGIVFGGIGITFIIVCVLVAMFVKPKKVQWR